MTPPLVVQAEIGLTTDDCRFLEFSVLPGYERFRELEELIAEHFGVEIPDPYAVHDFRFPGRYEVTIRRLDE